MNWSSFFHGDPELSYFSPKIMFFHLFLIFFKQLIIILLTNFRNLIHLFHAYIVLQRPNRIFLPIDSSDLRAYETKEFMNVIKTRVEFLNLIWINFTKSRLINWTLVFFKLVVLIKLTGHWTCKRIFADEFFRVFSLMLLNFNVFNARKLLISRKECLFFILILSFFVFELWKIGFVVFVRILVLIFVVWRLILSEMVGLFLIKYLLEKFYYRKLKNFLLEKISYCGPYCVISFT